MKRKFKKKSIKASICVNSGGNVCSIKFRSKHSSNTVLRLLRNLIEQTLIKVNTTNSVEFMLGYNYIGGPYKICDSH